MNISTVKNILNNEKKKLNTDVSEWLSFLEVSAYHYKHSVDDQVMIHAFNPSAKACADIMVWTNLRRNTVSGNSIPILKNGNIVYLYDIAQTESREDGSSVNPWIWSVEDKTLNASYEGAVSENLTEKYRLKSEKLPDKLYELSFLKTARYLNDRKSAFAWLTAESAAYCVMHRCCPDEVYPSLKNLSHLDKFDFEKIAEAVCGVSSEILSEIEAIAKSERAKKYESIRSKNNDKAFQRKENNQRNESHAKRTDGRMDSGNKVRKRIDLDTGRTLGNNDVLRSGGGQIEAVGDNKGNERQDFQAGGRSEHENEGTAEEIRNDGNGIQSDTSGGGSQILQNGTGLLEGNSGRGSTGESSREIHNAAPELSDESSSGDVSKIERKRTSELSSDGNKSESARTDGDYNRAAERKQSGIPAGGGTGGLPKNGTADGNIRKNSRGNDIKGDNLQRVNSSDIIGNTVYRYIKQKTYHKYDTETAKKIASELESYGVKFSGKINGESTTLTISKFDLEKFKEIEDKVANGESEKLQKEFLKNNENNQSMSIPKPEKALPGEPIVTVRFSEHPELSEGMKFPISQADRLFAELDKKQRSDRELYENSGWYHKTDFTVEYSINGEKNTYEGRYDIGDGDGSLTEHIKSYAQYMLKDDIIKSFSSDEKELDENKRNYKYILNELIPLFEDFTEKSKYKYTPLITEENYDTDRADVNTFRNKGKTVRSVDIPVKAADELRRRFELYGLKPSDEQTEISFSTYGDDWNRFEIKDKYGNRWVYVNAQDILSPEELETMNAVVSGFYNDKIQERSEIDDMLEFAQRAYYDSQYSGKDLYVYGAEPQMEQMSLFGEKEAAEHVSVKSSREKAITAVLMYGSGFADGKFRIADYADKNHSINDFAEMLKKEYGIGGHSGDDVNYSWTSHDGKGIQITLPRTNESEEGEKITVSWKEAAKRISKLCEQGEYITGEKAVEINSAPHSEVLMSSETKLQNKITFREVAETFGIDDKPLEVGDIVTIKDRPSEKWRVTEISSMQISFENVDENAKNRMFSHIDFGADRDNLKEKLGYIIVDDKENDRIERQSSEKAEKFNPDKQLKYGSFGDGEVETAINNHPQNIYRIYQLKSDKKYHGIRFEDRSTLQKSGIQLGINDYNLVYEGNFNDIDGDSFDDKLNTLYDRFNFEQPEDFKGRSLSVSDVITVKNGKNESAYYVDSIGFTDIPEFFNNLNENSKTENIKAQNYHINNDLEIGGAKAKFKANIAAIETLQKIEIENRYATPEEQEIMSRYTGWGGLSEAFDSSKEKWTEEYNRLKELLTEEEYKSAKASVLDSFYTPPYIIESIYSALKNMGFDGGNILEPALGTGNFLGKMPESTYKESRIYGTEIDSISGRIAKRLYPDADISITGFEKKDFPDSFFDIAVGNVPFGGFKVPDRRYDKYNFAVHDYFFAKTLDKVRPGGIVAFITSKGTLDKANPSVRKYISQRAELLGAVRLPNTAFKSYAGTEVTSDIIFLQKRERMIDIAPEWVYTEADGNGFACNRYFIDNPDMILGKTVEGNKLYGKGTMVIPFENFDLKEQLQKAVLKIKGEYCKESAVIADVSNTKKSAFVPEVLPADPGVKNFTYTEINGKIFYRENSIMTEISFKGKKLERIKGMTAINKCVRELLDMQLSGYSDEAVKEKQTELNSIYSSFTKKYGLLNSQVNKSAFKEDVSLPLLIALEKVKDGKLVQKADIFTKRTIRPQISITHVDTAAEALAVSISEKACVDLGFMASLMGGSEKTEQIKADLKGVIYKNPEKGGDELSGWETAAEYLSGNIREKLTAAEKAAADNHIYKENVQALESVIPERIEAGDIRVKLGAPWIDEKYITQFIYEILDTSVNLQVNNGGLCIDVQHSNKTASWVITNKSLDSGNIKATVTYGTARKNAYEIAEDSLNQRDTTVNDPKFDDDGKIHYVLNHKETVLARQKQEAINNAFREWIFRDRERREFLVEKYNVQFNCIRPREYDGSHLTFAGMNPEKELRPHQKNAVARAIYGGNTLFAHEVGAGKTYEMIATAMEGKRLGLCSKSLIAVPNHLTEQFANDFIELYPNANILVAGEKDFSKENRRKLCAKISTGDFDAVIIGHSQLIKVGVSPEREQEFIKQQIEEVTDDIAEIKKQNGEHFTIKEMEKTKKDMETRLKQLSDRIVKDDVITFEQLGVDKLFIDEADMFKNLGLSTKMRNISGVSANTKVQKTQDLYMKCQYIDELTGGKGIVFATGTPNHTP